MNFDITDELKPNNPWQKLESILSVWIEMIQRQKVVALPDNVGEERYESSTDGKPLLIQGPERDPLTGAKRISSEQRPWTIVPYSAQDLSECLELWDMIVRSIEEKMGLGESQPSKPSVLLDDETLDSAKIPDGFARKFLSQATRPRFDHIAPGLRIPTPGMFTDQPFISSYGEDDEEEVIPPILLFRGDGKVDVDDLVWLSMHNPNAARTCPAGLYLTGGERSYRYPQEDGCSLVLPFTLSGTRAKQSDGSCADQYDSLLQAGKNPFNDMHPVQLQAFLEKVYQNVQREDGWAVDANGVADGVERWREADTEQGWKWYSVPIEAGCYW